MLFRSNWVRELGTIADSATVEHGRCILGHFSAGFDTLRLVGIYNAPALLENPWAVRTGACPPYVTKASWHIHLPWVVNMMDPRLRAPIPPETVCFLSLGDRHAAKFDAQLGIFIQIVQVNARIACAWALVGDTILPFKWPP